jgi:hypothetical protein
LHLSWPSPTSSQKKDKALKPVLEGSSDKRKRLVVEYYEKQDALVNEMIELDGLNRFDWRAGALFGKSRAA